MFGLFKKKPVERKKEEELVIDTPPNMVFVNWETILGEPSKYTGIKPYVVRIEVRESPCDPCWFMEDNYEKRIKTPIPKGGIILHNCPLAKNHLLFWLQSIGYKYKPSFDRGN